ncbi:sulfur carrier protein ThiS [Luteolibacter luteus]|uniref:Sulfur carrier protein ThiS n=1 Tax=Luteolibacter luteus TaxID=2728835 RepID=A0A858RDA1_9BACT|nr:sulfur carrier protein ThiS [Luteolibacter luteus]QJE94574.1 sulfur carrier protein ThiS [Luteolibacter luteus]
MNLVINGESRFLESDTFNVATLLEALGFGGKPVVVELNEEAVFPASYPTTDIKEGAKLEIVMIAAGG